MDRASPGSAPGLLHVRQNDPARPSFSGTRMTAANETYDVFVSYSRADKRHAAEIDSFLYNKGLKSFFNRRNLDPLGFGRCGRRRAPKRSRSCAAMTMPFVPPLQPRRDAHRHAVI
jgi:hypothetical protein